MNYLIFGGHDTRDLFSSSSGTSLVLTSMPDAYSAAVNTAEDTVDGYDGSYIKMLNRSTIKREAEFAIVSDGLTAAIETMQAAFAGAGHLVTSDDPLKYCDAYVIDEIQWQKITPRYATATIKFVCQPYKYLLVEAETTLTAAGAVVNQGLAVSRPLIALTLTGDVTLTVNGEQVGTYSKGDVDTVVCIDSESMEIYNQAGTSCNRNYVGEFPALNPGSNTISWDANVTRAVITPRSRWLG